MSLEIFWDESIFYESSVAGVFGWSFNTNYGEFYERIPPLFIGILNDIPTHCLKLLILLSQGP